MLFGVALAALLFFGSVRLALRSQARVARQARLDACAVGLATKREALFRALARTNAYVHYTVVGVNIARGLRFVPLPAVGVVAGVVGERALLAANRALAVWQEGEVLATVTSEVLGVRCPPTRYSDGLALCWVRPGLRGALARESTFFKDLHGRYEFKEESLGKVQCAASLRDRTEIEVRGDRSLREETFSDEYTR